ncbi:MAG TPA: N-acetyltransferase [Thermoplasmatales archaeon]|nr:N-acetyltransferase [Thermoplasmatales archaeon]
MKHEYQIVERSPTPEEYKKLRQAVRWVKLDDEAIRKGLENSLFSVCAVFQGEIIGCGRVIGDDGIYFYIQDVIVLPEFQGKGVGKCIMNVIIEYLKTHAHNNSFIGLMAAKGVSAFYEKYGFKKRANDAPGMFLMWKTR